MVRDLLHLALAALIRRHHVDVALTEQGERARAGSIVTLLFVGTQRRVAIPAVPS